MWVVLSVSVWNRESLCSLDAPPGRGSSETATNPVDSQPQIWLIRHATYCCAHLPMSPHRIHIFKNAQNVKMLKCYDRTSDQFLFL